MKYILIKLTKIVLVIFTVIVLLFLLIIFLLRLIIQPNEGRPTNFIYINTEFSTQEAKKYLFEIQEGEHIIEIEKKIGKPFRYYSGKETKHLYHPGIKNFSFAALYTKEKTDNFWFNYDACYITLYFNKDSTYIGQTKIWYHID